MQDLGGPEKLKGWKITGEREFLVPERLKFQNNQLAYELERLKALGRDPKNPPLSQLPRQMLGEHGPQATQRNAAVVA